jgi:hypothetical protein
LLLRAFSLPSLSLPAAVFVFFVVVGVELGIAAGGKVV